MKTLKQIPFYTFLLPLFFCLQTLSGLGNFVTGRDAGLVGLPIFLSVVVLFTVVFLISKNRLLTGFTVFIASACYLFFGDIKDVSQGVPFFSSYLFVIPLLLSLIVTTVIALRKNGRALEQTTFFLNVLLTLYCLYDFAAIYKDHPIAYKRPAPSIPFNYSAVREKPDVYFLLLDGYAGFESLRDSFNYDNSDFQQTLRGLDFQQVSSFSNYTITPLSMSSIFNMSYDTAVKNSAVTIPDIYRNIYHIRHAEVFGVFEKMGYRIRNFSLFDVGDEEPAGGGIYFPLHKKLFTNKIFHNRFFRDIASGPALRKISPAFAKKMLWGDLPRYNESVENKLLVHARLHEKEPQFIYAHFLMPHYPHFFDSSGHKVADEVLLDQSYNRQRDMTLYLSYLKYCNNKLTAYVTEIIRNHPTAMIVIMSDHGYRGYGRLPFEPAFTDNICEVRAPGSAFPASGKKTSAVNFFRLLFNASFGQHLPLLPDSAVTVFEPR